MIRRLLFFITWLVELPFLSLQAQSPGGVTRTAEGDSTSAGNQSMRVVTFKAVPGTERTYYYHRDHLGSTTLITNKSGEVVQRVEYLGNNSFRVWPDKYDFNIQTKNFFNWSTIKRNIETIGAKFLHGTGTPYKIIFNGLYYNT